MMNISSLFKYSIYIGHSTSNSLILSSWFFYKIRKRIWIINLFKTIIFIKLLFKFLKYLTINNLPFWFINLDLSKEFLFKKYALQCGEFACIKIWIRGFLSNFKSIQNAIGKYILKKHILKTNKKKNLINMWFLTRFSWPRGVFLSDVTSNYVICKEASNILLPVVALVDTNIKSYLFNYPIPSNDDALESINYILSLISKKLLLYKYKRVLIWYNKYKVYKNKKTLLYNLLKIKKNFKKWKRNSLRRFKFFKKKSYKIIVNNKYNFKRYLTIKLLYNKNLIKKIFLNSLNTYQYFIKNVKRLTNTVFTNISKFNFNLKTASSMRKFYLLKKKKKYLKKIFKIMYKNKYLLGRRFLKLKQSPLYLYERTRYLKYFRKKKSDIYLFYYLISNYFRKSRVLYETFFINTPSNLTFIRAFHKFNVFYYHNKTKYDNSKFRDKRDYWYAWNGYRYKIDYRRKQRFLKSRFNMLLRKYFKYNRKLDISDSAILFNIERWITYSRKIVTVSRAKRFLLNYWLYPYFRRFSVKDNNRWYSAKFYFKEDTTFEQHFNWKLFKYNTPLTTFHFYNNWFAFLFKFKLIRFKKRKRRIIFKKIKRNGIIRFKKIKVKIKLKKSKWKPYFQNRFVN